MSSFVIAKQEYIKAAGIVAGIADASRDFWLFSYETGRNSTAQDIYNTFAKFHYFNAESVAEQYHDKHIETDYSEYKETFTAYMEKGKQLLFRSEQKKALLHLKDFFQSALYQTEKQVYADAMETYFNRILNQLIDIAFPREHESWGSLEI